MYKAEIWISVVSIALGIIVGVLTSSWSIGYATYILTGNALVLTFKNKLTTELQNFRNLTYICWAATTLSLILWLGEPEAAIIYALSTIPTLMLTEKKDEQTI
jgi:apolipoprotein N-acyltransferase